MKKVTTLMCILLCVLFAFTSCSNEPRKATEDEAKIIRSLDKINFESITKDSGSLKAYDSRAITGLKVTGTATVDGDVSTGSGTLSEYLKFKLNDCSVSFKENGTSYSYTFDGTLKQQFKAGITNYEISAMNSLTLDVKVNFNGQKYKIRIEQSGNGLINKEKAYFVGNQQVIL